MTLTDNRELIKILRATRPTGAAVLHPKFVCGTWEVTARLPLASRLLNRASSDTPSLFSSHNATFHSHINDGGVSAEAAARPPRRPAGSRGTAAAMALTGAHVKPPRLT
ncbi:hypothetical protein EYF80_015504 [Liparis tanakae]|uniref:Uncharacterized protein n=1 Tax=Liparis tanakae TaxID=230148 RepID=A0A4Z2I940_9TELE|nr:hypothetical protein EYF80_015504 [Liparis tanakae]